MQARDSPVTLTKNFYTLNGFTHTYYMKKIH
jgi:hypothetical protein